MADNTSYVKHYSGPLDNFNTEATSPNGIYFAKDSNQVVGLIYHQGRWFGADTLDLVWNASAGSLSWYNFDPSSHQYVQCSVDFNGVVQDVAELKKLLLEDSSANPSSAIDRYDEIVEFLNGVSSDKKLARYLEELDNVSTYVHEEIPRLKQDVSSLKSDMAQINASAGRIVWTDMAGNPIDAF